MAERLSKLHRPYHRALRALLEVRRRRFGFAVLLDVHSMPDAAPDVVLSDRRGRTCASALTDLAERCFEDAELSVARNKPFAGCFVVRHHGRPEAFVHALQIEVGRQLLGPGTGSAGRLAAVLEELIEEARALPLG